MAESFRKKSTIVAITQRIGVLCNLISFPEINIENNLISLYTFDSILLCNIL